MTSDDFPNFHAGTAIGALRFGELPGPLALDNYQRPYVWGAEKARQLLSDLGEHVKVHGANTPYYMGTLSLHQTRQEGRDGNGKLYVIDGQQRLTTLAMLHRVIYGYAPNSIDFRFRSSISQRHIREVYKTLSDIVKPVDDNLRPLLDRLVFTVVAVEQLDLAFTFFDTQNSRGVPLATTDLLKAYHLRAIKGEKNERDREEAVQKLCARRWEGLQIVDESTAEGKSRDFAPELFHYYLWRARNWRGQQAIVQETRDQVLDCFQKQVVAGGDLDSVPLYPTPANQLARRLRLDGSGDLRLEAGEIALVDRPADLPFALRQPIHAGLGFFLYAARYAALTRRLFKDKSASKTLEEYRKFYTNVVAWNSPYLRQLHRLAVLMYYDQFSQDRLLEFAWALEYVLGAVRLTKQRVFQRSAMKYLEETRLNLLDVISAAYRPEEVLDFLLRPEHRVGEDTRLDQAYNNDGPEKDGVQRWYFHKLSGYFAETDGFCGLRWSQFKQGMEKRV